MSEEAENELQGKVILIVDDEEGIRQSLSTKFTMMGVNTLLAGTGLHAEQILKSQGDKVDVILSDLSMPGMTGLQLARRVNEDEALKNIPIIFMTAHAEREQVVKAAKYGVTSYIIKPFKFDDVKAELQKVFS